jgi:predicted GNAT family N-acyltransferase
MRQVEIVEVRSRERLEQAFAIRRAVFVQEQGVSETLEFDGRDEEARHLLALRDGDPVGTLRLRWVEGGRVAKIERVAVLPRARGVQVGGILIKAAVALARTARAEVAMLHAQTVVQEFYAKLGFVAFGPEFIEDGIPHVAMRLFLRGAAAGDREGRR